MIESDQQKEDSVYDFPIFAIALTAAIPSLVRAIFICYRVIYQDHALFRPDLNGNEFYDDELSEGRSFLTENLQVNVSNSNWDFMQNHWTRSLQQTQCNLNATAIGDEVALDPPDSTWSSIALTFYIAGSIGLAVLLLYELFRRDPIIGKYVYDRKRLVQPDRTPPPLMLSRSLWQGYDDDNEATGCDGANKRQNFTCWKVRPALLEIFFLNLNEDYVRYSQAADNARREREKRGIYSCCRSGCYHDNCYNRTQRRNGRDKGNDQNGGEYVDQDGYVFYPGYNCSNSYDESDDDNRQGGSTVANDNGDNQENGAAIAQVLEQMESQQPTHSKKLYTSIHDLFPEDFRSHLPDTKATTDGSIGRLGSILASNGLSIGGGQIPNPENEFIGKGDDSDIVSPNARTDKACEEEDWVGRVSMIGENSKGIQIGTSGATGEMRNSKYDLPSTSEESKDFPRTNVGELEWKDLKINYCCSESESYTSCKARQTVCLEDGLAYEDLTVDEEKSASRPPLKYPNRFQTYFLPPGFHNWSDVWKYLGYLLFLSRCRGQGKDSNPVFTPSSPTNQSSLPSVSPRNDGSYPQLKIRAQEIPLTPPERELLRCAGLDTYLMIRFARFGFDVTFYPFAVACVTVFPVYISSSRDSWKNEGFFSLTINRVDENDSIMWVVVFFTVLLYLFVLRRLWMEWEVVIKLRHHFLENGDENFHKSSTYLKKFRNTCIVECVPKRHRSDRSLQIIFEKLFPGQIKNAEMVINTSTLDKILDKRRKFLDKYESVVARYKYEKWKYDQGSTRCCVATSEPIEPQVRTSGSCFKGTNESAIKHYKTMVDQLKVSAHEEYDKIVEKRMQVKNARSSSNSLGNVGDRDNFDMYFLFLPSLVQEALGLNIPEFFCGTGFVEFKSLSAKQSAVQCNLSGEPNWMITRDAPDPRDILWSNICTEHTKIETRKIVTQLFLVIGILVWGTFVTIVTNAANKSIDNIRKADPFQDVNESNSNLVVVLRGYIPPFIVSLILLWLPQVFFILAVRVIRFKSLSQVDEFVMKWNTGYRLANIFFVFFSISLIDAFRCFKDDPELFIQLVAEGILRQSTFLINLVLISTGQETMLQLLQWRSLIKQALYRPLVNLNKRSRRYLDRLNEAPDFEKAFIFGFFAPTLSYGLMVAMMYSYMAPLVLGVCSFFFWVASKVHTHNALYVYVQPFEGGGKIFYYWNRIVFTTLYSSIIIFSGVLALKKFPQMSVSFLIIMILVTVAVDKSIQNTFVSHSLNLPMTIARINDEEEAALLQKSETKSDGGENFIYRHPMLNQANWDKRPFWWG